MQPTGVYTIHSTLYYYTLYTYNTLLYTHAIPAKPASHTV